VSTGVQPVCGARTYLPTDLVPAALALETSTDRPAVEADVERNLRCTRQDHDHEDEHTSLVLELDGVDTGSVWARWFYARLPERLVVLPDCPGANGQACSEFEGHPGGHSFEIHDPLDEIGRALLPS